MQSTTDREGHRGDPFEIAARGSSPCCQVPVKGFGLRWDQATATPGELLMHPLLRPTNVVIAGLGAAVVGLGAVVAVDHTTSQAPRAQTVSFSAASTAASSLLSSGGFAAIREVSDLGKFGKKIVQQCQSVTANLFSIRIDEDLIEKQIHFGLYAYADNLDCQQTCPVLPWVSTSTLDVREGRECRSASGSIARLARASMPRPVSSNLPA